MPKRPDCLHCVLKKSIQAWCVEYVERVGEKPTDVDILSALMRVSGDVIRNRPAGPMREEAVRAVRQYLDLYMAEPDGAPH